MAPTKLPMDFETALAESETAREAWGRLAPGHRREHLEAIEGAKRPDTRARRIKKAIEMLAGGTKRPVAPSTKGLTAKLQVKPGMRLVMLNAPAEATDLLGELPADVTMSTRMSGAADVVVQFVRDRADLEKWFASVQGKLGASAVLWIAYPKKAAGIPTDLNRDSLNATIQERDYQGNFLVSMSDAWAVMRVKRM